METGIYRIMILLYIRWDLSRYKVCTGRATVLARNQVCVWGKGNERIAGLRSVVKNNSEFARDQMSLGCLYSFPSDAFPFHAAHDMAARKRTLLQSVRTGELQIVLKNTKKTQERLHAVEPGRWKQEVDKLARKTRRLDAIQS